MTRQPVTFGPVLDLQQIEEAALLGGWPAGLVPEAASIAEVESGGQARVVNSIGAAGMWQMLNHPQITSVHDPLQPVPAAAGAYELYKEQGFSGAWLDWEPPGAYTAWMGRAAADLPGAEAAVRASGGHYAAGGATASTAPGSTGKGPGIFSGLGLNPLGWPGQIASNAAQDVAAPVLGTIQEMAVLVPVLLAAAAIGAYGLIRATRGPRQKIEERADARTAEAAQLALAAA